MIVYQLTKDESCFYDINKFNLNKLGVNIYDKLSDNDRVIFGAGVWGRQIKKLYSDVCFYGYVDNEKYGKGIDGLNVLSLDEMLKCVPNAQIIIAVKNYSHEITQQLIDAGVKKNNILNMEEIVSEAYKMFEARQYFDLPYIKHNKEEVFVDVGAFDSMSSGNFIKWANNNYKKIFLFEANVDFHDLIENNMKALGARYKLIPRGFWNEEAKLTFFESPHDAEYNINLDEHNCFDKKTKIDKNG